MKANQKSSMEKLLNIIDGIETKIGVFCFIAMSIIVLTSIFMRFVLKIPFMWGEEAARYLMVVGIYFGMSLAVRQKAHLGVDIIINVLPVKLSRLINVIGQLIAIFTYAILTYFAYLLVQSMMSSGQTTPALGLPAWVVYSSLLIGFILSAFESILVLYGDLTSKEKFEVTDEGGGLL